MARVRYEDAWRQDKQTAQLLEGRDGRARAATVSSIFFCWLLLLEKRKQVPTKECSFDVISREIFSARQHGQMAEQDKRRTSPTKSRVFGFK